jgi:hypothetical protein
MDAYQGMTESTTSPAAPATKVDEDPKAAPAVAVSTLDTAARSGRAAEGMPDASIADTPTGAPAHRFALLAASVGIAAAVGAAVGSLATAGIMMPSAASKPVITTAIEDSRIVREGVAKLGSELVALKNSLDASGRSATAQFAKIADRFEKSERGQNDRAARLNKLAEAVERVERAQAEPGAKLSKLGEAVDRTQADTAAKLAKLGEALDRLERRQIVQHGNADVTGSVGERRTAAAQAEEGKPGTVDGWTLQEVFRGRAVVESRKHGVYEVTPGSTLPGIGRVEDVVRQDGRWVVVTSKGVITANR